MTNMIGCRRFYQKQVEPRIKPATAQEKSEALAAIGLCMFRRLKKPGLCCLGLILEGVKNLDANVYFDFLQQRPSERPGN